MADEGENPGARPLTVFPFTVHVGKTMIVIALFWLALWTEGGVLDLHSKAKYER